VIQSRRFNARIFIDINAKRVRLATLEMCLRVESSCQSLILDEMWLILIIIVEVDNAVIIACLALTIPMVIAALELGAIGIVPQRKGLSCVRRSKGIIPGTKTVVMILDPGVVERDVGPIEEASRGSSNRALWDEGPQRRSGKVSVFGEIRSRGMIECIIDAQVSGCNNA
jgi:hypothetical protein